MSLHGWQRTDDVDGKRDRWFCYLVCDSCERRSVRDAGPVAHSPDEAARLAVRVGWRRVPGDVRVMDYCPRCAPGQLALLDAARGEGADAHAR